GTVLTRSSILLEREQQRARDRGCCEAAAQGRDGSFLADHLPTMKASAMPELRKRAARVSGRRQVSRWRGSGREESFLFSHLGFVMLSWAKRRRIAAP